MAACATSPSSNGGEKLKCEQHAKIANILNQWGERNFDQTYGKDKDAKNASVQLFLIEQKAPANFARSFNQYEAKFLENYGLAKGKHCDVSAYPLSPINEFKAGINKLDAKSAS